MFVIMFLLAVAVGAVLGWKAQAHRCGPMCDPAAASRSLGEHHAGSGGN